MSIDPIPPITEVTDRGGRGDAVPRGNRIHWFAGRLHTVLDTVLNAPAWAMTAAEQQQTLVELTTAQARISELRLRVLAAADTNGIGADTGASSSAAWLAANTSMTRTSAHGDLHLATALTDHEPTRTALATGQVLVDQAWVILQALDKLPDRVTAEERVRAETFLVEQAAVHDAKALRILGRRLFEVIDPDAADEEEGKALERQEREARKKASFSMRDNGDGTHTGTFKLPDLHASMLKKALQALVAPRRVGENRCDADGKKIPYSTLLGHGLMEYIEKYPTDTLPDAGGTNATIVVTMTLEQLLGGLGAASLDDGTRISASEARRLACEAKIIPMVLGGDSMPLDVGRARRFHTKYQRIAMAHRDGGCVAEDCDRPPAWCEAHHDKAWAAGGDTSIENGSLRCSYHHTLAHDDGYLTTKLPNGKVRYRRRQ